LLNNLKIKKMVMENPFSILERRLNRLEHLLELILESSVTLPGEDQKPLGISEAAKHIGKSKPTIYRLVGEREIPHHKKGGKLYFFKEELDEWIKTGKVKTKSDHQK
jgi:excisionase family DNA binding protein